MDTTQTVVLAIIITLAVFLVALGFQSYFVLRDLRRSLHRMNRLFDDVDLLVKDVRKPIETASTLVTALTAGAGITHLLGRITKVAKDSKEIKVKNP